MAKSTKKIGGFGEELAQNFLTRRDYKIIHTNFTLGAKEIDIIAQQENLTVFVEVKSRTSPHLQEADTALTPKQIKTLKKAISLYCYRNKINKNQVRLDLIAIDINKTRKKAHLKHYRDIL